jgi:D-alanyl-lipoteichoic acid acyltransferase DltB (MBOAT superfamily)
MEITTLVFLAFVCGTCLIYYIIPKKFQWCVLLVASLVFFVSSSALLTVYMLATTGIVYGGARIIQKSKMNFELKKKELTKDERKVFKAKHKKTQKLLVALFTICALAILVALKYCNFLGAIVNTVVSLVSTSKIIPEFSILLPLGISYYTLMSVSYIVDVYRGVIVAEKNPLRVLLYVCYFPHIVEGPFDKYKDLDAQFRTPHNFDYDKVRQGAILVMFGFFKKLVIADRIGQFVSDAFSDTTTGTAVIMGTLLYTFQLYMDFSGCIDIVSGVSELFGIKIAENFRQPFFSKSINEFWRRWHITLGLWLKEYVFYPVTLSGHFKKVNHFVKKHIKNITIVTFVPAAYSLFFVWFCNGLWHGASIKYIVYGLYYYVFMMLGELLKPFFDKTKHKLHIKNNNKIFELFQIMRTFIIVNIGMLLFKSVDLLEFLGYIRKIFTSYDFSEVMVVFPTKGDLALPLIGFVIVLIVGVLKEKSVDIRLWLIDHTFVIRWIVYLFLIFSTMVLGVYGVEYGEGAAIYAQF